MKELNNNEKISLIKKYYRRNSMLLEMQLINYDYHNLYICINKMDKQLYRLSWFELDDITSKDIEKYVSCQYIVSNIIDMIKEDFSKILVSSKYEEESITENDLVILKANIKTKEEDCIDVCFNKYLPKALSHLDELLIFIFNNMPRRFEDILFKLLARLTDTVEKYDYKKEFNFDLFKGKLDELFDYPICTRGEKYYKESRVVFLEKIDDRYFAVVEGTQEYIIIINYNKKEKKMWVYCSCPCEFYCKHMYAVILAIRNKDFNRFFKIVYDNPNTDLYEKIANFNYILCLGIVEQNFEIINNYGEIELIPILDANNEYHWQIIEDTEDEKLAKQVKYFLNNNI